MKKNAMSRPASWDKTFAVWWAFAWRAILLTIPCTVVLSVAGLVAAFVNPGQGGEYGAAFGQLGTLPASVLAFRWVLNKRFRTFTLIVGPQDSY